MARPVQFAAPSRPQTLNSVQVQTLDQVQLTTPPSKAASHEILASIIRRAPNQQVRDEVIQALSYFPEGALRRIADFGTRIEVFDPGKESLPLYAHNLSKPNVAGCYSPRANILAVPTQNISPLVLLHEMAHALDLSLGEVSLDPKWQGAHAMACATRQVVRPYATKNVGEYFAENVAAHLVPDGELKGMLVKSLPKAGVEPAYYINNHQNYSRGRLAQIDGEGSRLAQEVLQSLHQQPAPKPRPALSEAEYRAEMQSLLKAKKQQQAMNNPVSLLME